MQLDTVPPDESAPLIIDSALLDRLERDLADAAEVLERIEVICATNESGDDTARAVRALLDDGRFEVSDLVGHGDVDAAEQVDPVAHHESTSAVGQPASGEVGHAIERGTERDFDLVDQAPVGDHDGIAVTDGIDDATDPAERPLA